MPTPRSLSLLIAELTVKALAAPALPVRVMALLVSEAGQVTPLPESVWARVTPPTLVLRRAV